MKRAIVACLVFASAAHASPPAGWTAKPGELPNTGHFGTQNSKADAVVFMPPGTASGVELIVTRATATVNDGDRSAATRAEVDELHAMSHRAAMAGSGIAEDSWQERANPAAHQIEAELSWHDGGAKLVETARLVIAADPKQLAATIGECIARDDADATLIAACKASLATLDPGIDPKTRVPLELAATGTPAPAPPANSTPAPQISAGTHTPLPPIAIAQDAPPPADRRPMLVGAGLVALAVLFWWNTRRRAALEREAQGDASK